MSEPGDLQYYFIIFFERAKSSKPNIWKRLLHKIIYSLLSPMDIPGKFL